MNSNAETDGRITRREFVATSSALCTYGYFASQASIALGQTVGLVNKTTLVWGLEPTFAVPQSCRFVRTAASPLVINNLVRNIEDQIYELRLRRAADLLNLHIELLGGEIENSHGKLSFVANALGSAYLIVHFPPQHVAEDYVAGADLDCGKEPTTTNVPNSGCLSRPSRLVFKIPSRQKVPLELSQLLQWQSLKLAVSKLAIPKLNLQLPDGSGHVTAPANTTINEPADMQTAILLPDGLVVSPHEFMGWDHNEQVSDHLPTTADGSTSKPVELWETRAVLQPKFVKANEGQLAKDLKTLRAVYSYPSTCRDDVLPDTIDRLEIVELSAGFKNKYGASPTEVKPYDPPPIECKDLRLAPHGGSIRAKGNWIPENVYISPSNLNPIVQSYEQQTFQGRDQYVRIERVYFGCPIGVKVTLVQIRQREFVPVVNHSGETGTGAVLVERWYSRCAPLAPFTLPANGDESIGRRWPFEHVEFNWPNGLELRKPVDILDGKPANRPKACWMIPKCGSEPLEIEAHCRDRQGLTQVFKLPLLLIRLDIATAKETDIEQLKDLQTILERYSSDHDWPGMKKKHYRDVVVDGQRIGLVPAPAALDGDKPETKDNENRGALVTNSMSLGVEAQNADWTKACFPDPEAKVPSKFLGHWKRVKFYPAVAQLNIPIREAEAYAKPGKPITANVGWNSIFNQVGFDAEVPARPAKPANVGEVFLDVFLKKNEGETEKDDQPPGLDFGGDKGGGLATPSITIQSFSRKIGTVGGNGKPARGALAAAATGPPLQNGKFDPKDYFGGALDAKLIGDLKLKDLLTVVDLGDDRGEIPKLVSEDLADVNAGLSKLQELIEQIKTVQALVSAVPLQLIDQLDELAKHAQKSLEDLIISKSKDFVVQKTKELLNDEDLPGQITSAMKTLRMILDSMERQYPSANHEALLKIKDAFDTDDLVHVVGEPLAAAYHEFRTFVAINVLGPWKRLKEIIEQLTDPAKLVTGSVLEEIENLSRELGIDTKGTASGTTEDAIKEAARAFLERLRKAVDAAIKSVAEAITGNGPVVEGVGPAIKRIEEALAPFPNAIEVAAESAVKTRLNAYKLFLSNIEQQWQTRANDTIREISNFIEKDLVPPAVPPLLTQLAEQYKKIRKEVDAMLAAARNAIAQIPRSISYTYTWDTPLKTGPTSFPIFVGSNMTKSARAKLVLKSRIEKKLGLTAKELESPLTMNASVILTDFQIVLIPKMEFVIVGFKRLSVESHGLEKPTVQTQLEKVAFGDCLAFVQKLASLFSKGSGFYADVTFLSIRAGYRYEVPDFSVGAFNLADLSLGVHFTLPFDGTPIGLGMNVSERHRPCLLSVGIYGGGAFFGLELSPRSDGNGTSVRALETAFEFGAVVRASIGPAKGQLYVFGGTYFGRRDMVVQLTGYVRAGGSLEVLIITASVEFYLGLTYLKRNESTCVFGEASVTVHVKVMFVINVHVKLKYYKEFAGSQSEKRGALTAAVEAADKHVPMVYSEWLEYCNQFA